MAPPLRERYAFIIGDEEVLPNSAPPMPVVDPTTGQTVAEVPVADRDTVDRAVRTAVDASRSWRKLAPAQRRDYLRRLGAAVTADRDRLATLDAYDSGNPRRAMLADADHGVRALEYFAGISPELHGATVPASASGLHFSLLEPYGVVVRIIPFNHPLMFCLLHAAAPLAAGNVVILKAPDQTPLAPLEFARIAAEVLPPGVVTVLTGPGSVTGDALVRHPDVRRIAFTGRRETGLRVMSAAADSGVVKNITLELGGKNPLIALPDVTPGEVANAAVLGMNLQISQGQSCGSTSRVYVHEDLVGPATAAIASQLEALRVGDPLDETTDMGPLVSAEQLARVESFVRDGSVDARLVTGGGRPNASRDLGGFFLEPTMFDQVGDASRLAREEIFGPVLSILTWRDRDELLRRVNDSSYGLTANILTHHLESAVDIAREVEAGLVWVNGSGQHFTGTPFGGFKDSGLGLQGSMDELRSYVRVKAVHMPRPAS